ncbi:MAG TPA: ArdC-like ssDNA-binding domain-containing protein [Ferruginibacter sp.]|nr:ArdC-like ssDNA-binding domain-containing protein [Ferruginibacter sp.]HRQ20539.1 ArdC-like ssDNA-binding domain-containing protein [Ferruginibacter sp.]
MNQATAQKRQALKEISAPFKMMMKEGALNSINEGIVKMYASQGHTILKSFNAWKKEGYTVKKGEKALLLWGSPVKNEKAEKAEDGKDETFFPMAFVFSNLQVEKL